MNKEVEDSLQKQTCELTEKFLINILLKRRLVQLRYGPIVSLNEA